MFPEETRDRTYGKGDISVKQAAATTDEGTPANGITGSAGSAAAPEPEVETLESTPFDRAATKKRLEPNLRAGRLKAAKNKKAKPGGAHVYVWK